MMQNSNLRPDGSTAIQCDAGTPIMGRTSTTGTYQILKVNADGSLPGNASPLPLANYLAFNSIFTTFPPGTPGVNVLVQKVSLFSGNPITESGLYRLNPTCVFSGSGTGGIDFILYPVGYAIETYIDGLTPGTDAFNPTIFDTIGVTAFWHNTAVQNFGVNNKIAYNRDNSFDVYLDSGSYKLAIISSGGITYTGQGFVGFYEFSKIS